MAIFFVGLLFGNAFGQDDGSPASWCRNGLFPTEKVVFKLAKVTARKGERVYFYKDWEDENCPDDKNCREKSYLISGNEVITSRTYGKWTCAWYQPKKGAETVGWILTEKLKAFGSDPNPALNSWLGYWKYYDNSIEIERDKQTGYLKITGNAIWKGLGDNVHVGELEFIQKPQAAVLDLGDSTEDGKYDCWATLRLVGKYLIAFDNSNCGGMNVRFNGVYVKK